MAAKILAAIVLVYGALALNGCTACFTRSNPEQVRENTAAATAAIKSDAKAVAGGVIEGLRRPTPEAPVDINSGSKGALESLPGITKADADRIVAGRPYARTAQLIERRVLSREQYDKIADRITAKQ